MYITIIPPRHYDRSHMIGIIYSALESDEISTITDSSKNTWMFRTQRPLGDVMVALESAELDFINCVFIGISSEKPTYTVLSALSDMGNN